MKELTNEGIKEKIIEQYEDNIDCGGETEFYEGGADYKGD